MKAGSRMSGSNFNTANQTYRQLIGNGLTYAVPHFQRDYSWDEEEWDDLWQDIQNLVAAEEDAHYMGYLVLKTKDSKSFDIVDGQQRLTTLSILALAVLKNFDDFIKAGIDSDDNRKRQEYLRSSFIGYVDPVTLQTKSKLTLNRTNDYYYQHCMVPLLDFPKRNQVSSNQLLKKAFNWFRVKIQSTYGKQQDGQHLAAFIENLSDRLFFTVITVTDELNAYKVFETLNARGVKLSATDLLKNYLFSVVYKELKREAEITLIELRWDELVNQLGGDDFQDFLRTHWNSRKSFTRHADLFKTIRNSIGNSQAVFQLLNDMEEDVAVFAAISKPEDPFWKERPKMKEYISNLKMFNVRQIYSLLMAAYRMLSKEEFEEVLKASVMISFRYNVIGNYSTSEQETVYNSVARDISNKKLLSSREILNSLKDLYVDDTTFEQAFAIKDLRTTQHRNKKVVRYILYEIEKSLSNCDYDFDAESYSIEHILPENPGDGWDHFSDDELEQYLYRIGNMTLLEKTINKDIQNYSYKTKKANYMKSKFYVTKTVSELYHSGKFF